MLLTIAISLIYLEIQDWFLEKEIARFFKDYWTQWNIRVMVLASLVLQLLLIMSGHVRRRYIGKRSPYIAMFVWITYMLADWMATVVLSTILRDKRDLEPRRGLVALWTPFLLWHLGGPYNITAYSLEDNDMWLRHFFGMVFQVGEAIYIFSIYGNGGKGDRTLKLIATPILIAGFLKYGERIWALRCASDKELVKSVYSAPTEGKSMIRRGLYEYDSWLKSIEAKSATNGSEGILCKAYLAFYVFNPLFLDLPFELSKEFRDTMVYLDESEENAFKMVEIELEFLYDLQFTKLPIQHDKHYRVSLALRIFCFCSAVSSLIAFSLIPSLYNPPIPKVDIAITYLLLGQVILLDLCSYFLRSWSNWMVMKLPGHKFYSLPISPKLRRNQPGQGINVMAQHDVIKYYAKQASIGWCSKFIKFFDTNDLIQKFGYTKWKPVDLDLKKFILSRLKLKRQKCADKGFEPKSVSDLLEEKGEAVLKDRIACQLDDDSWNINTTDFTSRIFIWHIATELVYYDDLCHFRSLGSSCKIGKSLSDYMMYLALVRPLMLPKGFNEVINKLSYDQASKFFQHRRVSAKEFTNALLSSPVQDGFIYSITRSSIENILFKGRRFAKQLQDLARKHRWDDDEKWELISEVWMEMMIYAAAHCSWKEHAQQLRHGGELLTHVALLMAHLGLSTQIQKQKDLGEEAYGLSSENIPPFAI